MSQNDPIADLRQSSAVQCSFALRVRHLFSAVSIYTRALDELGKRGNGGAFLETERPEAVQAYRIGLVSRQLTASPSRVPFPPKGSSASVTQC